MQFLFFISFISFRIFFLRILSLMQGCWVKVCLLICKFIDISYLKWVKESGMFSKDSFYISSVSFYEHGQLFDFLRIFLRFRTILPREKLSKISERRNPFQKKVFHARKVNLKPLKNLKFHHLFCKTPKKENRKNHEKY